MLTMDLVLVCAEAARIGACDLPNVKPEEILSDMCQVTIRRFREWLRRGHDVMVMLEEEGLSLTRDLERTAPDLLEQWPEHRFSHDDIMCCALLRGINMARARGYLEALTVVDIASKRDANMALQRLKLAQLGAKPGSKPTAPTTRAELTQRINELSRARDERANQR
jgi:hypothetical protein